MPVATFRGFTLWLEKQSVTINVCILLQLWLSYNAKFVEHCLYLDIFSIIVKGWKMFRKIDDMQVVINVEDIAQDNGWDNVDWDVADIELRFLVVYSSNHQLSESQGIFTLCLHHGYRLILWIKTETYRYWVNCVIAGEIDILPVCFNDCVFDHADGLDVNIWKQGNPRINAKEIIVLLQCLHHPLNVNKWRIQLRLLFCHLSISVTCLISFCEDGVVFFVVSYPCIKYLAKRHLTFKECQENIWRHQTTSTDYCWWNGFTENEFVTIFLPIQDVIWAIHISAANECRSDCINHAKLRWCEANLSDNDSSIWLACFNDRRHHVSNFCYDHHWECAIILDERLQLILSTINNAAWPYSFKWWCCKFVTLFWRKDLVMCNECSSSELFIDCWLVHEIAKLCLLDLLIMMEHINVDVHAVTNWIITLHLFDNKLQVIIECLS